MAKKKFVSIKKPEDLAKEAGHHDKKNMEQFVLRYNRTNRENGIDLNYEKKLEISRRVQQYKKAHPGENKKEVAEALKKFGRGYSRANISRYWNGMPKAQYDESKKSIRNLGITRVDPITSKFAMASASNEDKAILRIIWKTYLQNFELGDRWYECDLTFAKGDFYKEGVPYPLYCFDLYPEQLNDSGLPDVYPLRDDLNPANPKTAANLLNDNSVSSIVIDLPQKINDNGETSGEAFQDMKDLAKSYYWMLKLADQKLLTPTNIQNGGILIIKVGDIYYKGKRIWLSDNVISLATNIENSLPDPLYEELEKEANKMGYKVEDVFPRFNFDLVDKYVHIYKDIDLNIKNHHSIKAHDYFLVFSKGIEKEPEYLYFISEYNNLINRLEGTLLQKNGYYSVSSDINKLKRDISKSEEYFEYRVILNNKTFKNCISTNREIHSDIRRELSKKRFIPSEMFENGNKLLKYLDDKIHISRNERNDSISELEDNKNKLENEIKALKKKIEYHKERKDKEWIRIDSSELKNKERELRHIEKRISTFKNITEEEKKINEERLKKREDSLISSISENVTKMLRESGVDYVEIVYDHSSSKKILVLNNSNIDLELIKTKEEDKDVDIFMEIKSRRNKMKSVDE